MDTCIRISRHVQAIGFTCIRCGACCSPREKDSNLVMVTPPEIQEIMERYRLSWEEIAEPYPETINDKNGHTFTLGWCIARKNGHCAFLGKNGCRIYEKRPWICRTYPFVLENENLRIFPCPGLGQHISWKNALEIGKDLIARKHAESFDEMKIGEVLDTHPIPDNVFSVIDSEGVKPLSGPASRR